MAKAKESIKNLRYIAESSGYVCWQDYLYDFCLNGNSLRRDFFDKMTKSETLMVIDAIVLMMLNIEGGGWDISVLKKMYLSAYNSLSERL